MAVDINKDRVEGRANEMGGGIQREFGRMTDHKIQQAKAAINKPFGAGVLRLADVAERARAAARKP
jgi:uncharacterized protein YjbJ (UPF0337 family)